MSDMYTAWNGQLYPNPPPEGWHKASDGRWWAPGTGPEASQASGSQTTPPTQPTADLDTDQTILPGEDLAIPSIKRDPQRAGTWPTAPNKTASPATADPAAESWSNIPVSTDQTSEPTATHLAPTHSAASDAEPTKIARTPSYQPDQPQERRRTREEVEASRTQDPAGSADTSLAEEGQPQRPGLAPRDVPETAGPEKLTPAQQKPVMYDPDRTKTQASPLQGDQTAQLDNQGTILPGQSSLPDSEVRGAIPKPATLENSTNAKGKPFVPEPPNPNARPLPVPEEEKSLAIPVLGSAVAAILLIGGLSWFFFLRGSDENETATEDPTTTAEAEQTTTTEPPTTTTISATTEAPTTTAKPTTTTDSPTTTEGEAVVPTSASIPPDQVVANFREKLASNGLSSAVLTDDDIVKFGEDFCFVASNSKDQAAFDTEAKAAIADSTSSLSDDELRLVIDTAVVVSCPEEAKRLEITI